MRKFLPKEAGLALREGSLSNWKPSGTTQSLLCHPTAPRHPLSLHSPLIIVTAALFLGRKDKRKRHCEQQTGLG